MPSQPIPVSLEDSLRQVEVMRSAIERLRSIDRAEYPDLAYELAQEARSTRPGASDAEPQRTRD